MKKTIIIAIISIGSLGCTKSPSSGDAGGKYSCKCFWKKNPVTDTSAVFIYSDTSKSAAEIACQDRDAWVKSLSGVSSGANCRLQ